MMTWRLHAEHVHPEPFTWRPGTLGLSGRGKDLAVTRLRY
jgi:hypothetical protein